MNFTDFDDSAATSSGGAGRSWFELALGAYTQIEIAKNTPTFAPPYQPVTYGTQPGAVAFDMKNLRERVSQSTGIPSGVLVAGVLALLGLVAYRLIK